MKQVVIEVERRQSQGKGAANQLRREGKVPGILYSKGGENTLVQLEARELKRILSTGGGKNVLLSLKIDGAEQAAMITEVQHDIFQKEYLHVDFHRVRMDEVIHATVPLVIHGPAAGEKEGGMVDQIRHDLEVHATPTALPQQIDVDVTGLGVGDSVHVRELKLPEGVTALTDGDEMVVVVHTQRAQEESPAAAVADPTLGAPAAGA